MTIRLLVLLALALPALSADLTRYVVVLNEAPALRTPNRLAAVQASHLPVRAALQTRGARITSESHTLLNAIFVEASGQTAAQLEAIPGVRYVARIPPFRPLLDRALDLLSVPAAWSILGGQSNAGAGMKIAVIDSGIEATHPAFQDAALIAPANYPTCSIAKLPLVPLDCTRYTNGKIIVARSYVPYIAAGSPPSPAANSRPDDYSPRDRVGHGTAVAMAAAGVRNPGPAATITGVAPKAWLGSYKVFGSPGLNDSTSADAVLAALEDAFADGMDVAVLSLGAPALQGPDDVGAICGNAPNQACDPFAAAVKNAVNGGMVVIAAAGNEGLSGTAVQPTWGSVTTPAHASAALAVAATTNSHNWSNPLTVAGLNTFHSLLGAGPVPNPAFAAPLGDASTVGDSEACNPLPAASLTGTYALVDRGTCTFAIKVQNLTAAGAVGAIIVNNPGDNTVFTPGGLSGATTIPAAIVGYDDGQAMRIWLQSNSTATAAMDPALQPFDVATANQIAGFSSRGPVLGTGAMKPDISAPGTDLYTAAQRYDPNGALFAPTGYLISQGTSFSAPLIAGIAALVKQANPALTAAQIKSAIVNTASQDVTDPVAQSPAQASLLAAGTGRASAANAISATLAAVPSNASFGLLVPGSKLPLAQAIQLTNTGKATQTLTLAANPRNSDAKATLTLDRPSVILAPGQTVTLNLTLNGSLPDPGVYEGFVTVTGSTTPFRIPWLYLSTDGIPWNIVPLLGDGANGTVSQSPSSGVVLAQVLDRVGIPVPNASLRFTTVSGGATLRNVDLFTDIYGFAGASVTLGPAPGLQTIVATSGGLSTSFTMTARSAPAIAPRGVVDAASFTSGAPVAPGSYIAIYGTSLATATQIAATSDLPVSLNHTSVSFDTGATSFPGRLHFATPGQVNVQVPWEFLGQASAQMKVSVQDSSGNLYTLPLATYAPGIFEFPLGGTLYAAARDENFDLITPANPAKQGRNIQLYCNGLGPVTNQPATGEPSPTLPLAETTTRPVVTIGGQPATVLFSGLTPTAVGLYQLNVTVPAVGSGIKTVTITVGNTTAKLSNLAVQ